MRTAITALVFAMLVSPPAGMAQDRNTAGVPDAAGQLIEQIEAIQLRDGADAAALIEPLTALSALQFEAGAYALSIEVAGRALGLVRANLGLSALEQTALLQLLSDAERSRGNLADAWAWEQELLEVARANPEALATVPVLRSIADRRLELMRRYVAGEHVPEVQIGCYYKAPRHLMGNCHAGSKGDAAASLLLDASEIYSDAADVIAALRIYPSEDFVELQTGLARNYYLHGRPRTAESAYELGRASLQRLHAYEVEHAGTLFEAARALVHVADWDLAYARQPLAIETYERALAGLRSSGAAAAQIERLFAPAIPVVIPAFLANPLESAQIGIDAAYVDVSFEISKYGRSRKVEVEGSFGDASAAAVDALERTIRLSRFRPRLDAEGELDTASVELRYYLEE